MIRRDHSHEYAIGREMKEKMGRMVLTFSHYRAMLLLVFFFASFFPRVDLLSFPLFPRALEKLWP